MRYYKVMREHYNSKHNLIENELITEKELKRFYPEIIPLWYIRRNIFTVINISSHRTYTMFGCRFELDIETVEH